MGNGEGSYNGSTCDFGSYDVGSNPTPSAIIFLSNLRDKTYLRLDMATKWTDAELAHAVKNSTSLTEVVIKLYGTCAGGHYATINRHLKRLGIDTGHFNLSQGRYHGPLKPDSSYLVNGTRVSSSKLRSILKRHKPYTCESCDNPGTHNNKPLMLQLDHIDGKKLNNTLENIRWLCPNCHSQTDTYSKPKSKPRTDTAIKPKTVTTQCATCRKDHEILARQFRYRHGKGQSKFYCSHVCTNNGVSTLEILGAYVDTKSYLSAGNTLGISNVAARKRLLKIADKFTPITQCVPSGNRIYQCTKCSAKSDYLKNGIDLYTFIHEHYQQSPLCV